MINIHDCPTIYHVPLALRAQGLISQLSSKLQLKMTIEKPKRFMSEWKNLAHKAEGLRKEVRIALVGKYTKLEDAYASVIKALTHAALAANYRLKLTYIAAGDLEESTKVESPVLFHDAWRKLCDCQVSLNQYPFRVPGNELKSVSHRSPVKIYTVYLSSSWSVN